MSLDIHHPIESFGIRKVSMSGIRVERLEDRVRPAVPFPHRHDFWQIVLISAGTGNHQIDFNSFKVKRFQVFIIKPGQVHRWTMDKNIKGLIVEFGRTNQLNNSPDELKIPASEFSLLESLASIMLNEFLEKRKDYDSSLRSLLVAFLIQLARNNNSQEERSSGIIENFRALVEKNYKTEHRVEFYARKLGITPKALTMQVSRALGKSPRLIIQERFLMEARRLLAFSAMNISEIGFELGFVDANYFTRFFRLHEKITPAAFRKKHS